MSTYMTERSRDYSDVAALLMPSLSEKRLQILLNIYQRFKRKFSKKSDSHFFLEGSTAQVQQNGGFNFILLPSVGRQERYIFLFEQVRRYIRLCRYFSPNICFGISF